MQEQETVKKKPKVNFSTGVKFLRLFWRSRSRPEAEEQVIKLVQSGGGSEEDIAFLKEVYATGRNVRLDAETLLRISRYLVGGIAVINLTLLSIILPMGIPDLWLKFALYALVISLPLAAGSLFFSFIKQESGVITYGNIHSALSLLSLIAGITAMTLSICHVLPVAGIVFFCLAIAVFILCSGYEVIFLFEKRSFIKLLKNAAWQAVISTSDNTKDDASV